MKAANYDKLCALFCKSCLDTQANEILYSHYFPVIQAIISFRSLDIETDLELIHHWVNQPYSKKFWQLAITVDELRQLYLDVLKSPQTHSIIGLVNDEPFCQIDIYRVCADQIKNHVNAGINDCGLHLLMMPPRKLKTGWSVCALKAFQDYYFSYSCVTELFAEPDRGNGLANQLALKAGFDFIKAVSLSHKEANVYSISRKKFQELNLF